MDDFGAGGVAQEEGHFGVFVQLGCFLFEGALAAGVLGFTVRVEQLARCLWILRIDMAEVRNAHICLNIMVAVLFV